MEFQKTNLSACIQIDPLFFNGVIIFWKRGSDDGGECAKSDSR